MSRVKEEANPARQIRFRGDFSAHNRIDDIEEDNKRGNSGYAPTATSATASAAGFKVAAGTRAKQKAEDKDEKENQEPSASFFDFIKVEMTRGYMLEHDEERYTARREKMYSFIRIPRDLERFMAFGLMQCADSFFYIHTFLPVRFAFATWGLLTRPIANFLGMRRRTQRLLTPAEICDILKGVLWILCALLMISIDTNRIYHIIKSQSIIKLYIFYNMLEVGDRLLSAFGQDIMDALLWTATEPKHAKQARFGLLTHIMFALFYIVVHTSLIMFQATTLNVALNSNNKALLTIMISNNFVELKGSVFKKFDKNNLFQLTCSDVRERFHLAVLLFIVTIQTMKEFDWSFDQFQIMIPDCIAVVLTEMLIDWVKHAFITRFNELPESIYKEYTTSLAYDMTQTRQKHAFSDHSDLVARRMGFIPFPLSVVLIKAIYAAVSFDNVAAWVLVLLVYLFALSLRVCVTICALGKACKLMKEHQIEKSNSAPSSVTNIQPIPSSSSNAASIMLGLAKLPQTPQNTRARTDLPNSPTPAKNTPQRSSGVEPLRTGGGGGFSSPVTSLSITAINTSTPKVAKKPNKQSMSSHANDLDLSAAKSLELGATALFSNSDVELDDVCLNEHVLETNTSPSNFIDEELARSVPDLSQQQQASPNNGELLPSSNVCNLSKGPLERPKRTHKRSESEPSMQSIVGDGDAQT